MQGIAGICVFGGDECYIKLQIKANLPHLEAQRKESRMFDLVRTHDSIQNTANWREKIMSHDKKGEQKSRLLLSCYRPLFSISLIQGCYHVFFSPVQMNESMPLRFDEGFLRWVAGEQSLKDTSFLSNKVLGLCGELPIYWLHPTFTKGFLSLFILCLKQTAFPEKLVHFVKKH